MKCEYTVILFRVLAVYRCRTSQLTEEQEGEELSDRPAGRLAAPPRQTDNSVGGIRRCPGSNQPASTATLVLSESPASLR